MSQRAGTVYRIVILTVATAITVSAVLHGRPFVLIALAALYAGTVFRRRRTGHW